MSESLNTVLSDVLEHLVRTGTSVSPALVGRAVLALRSPAADQIAALTAGPNGEHLYLCTYCWHGNHTECRRVCKSCAAMCLCTSGPHGQPTARPQLGGPLLIHRGEPSPQTNEYIFTSSAPGELAELGVRSDLVEAVLRGWYDTGASGTHVHSPTTYLAAWTAAAYVALTLSPRFPGPASPHYLGG